MQIKSDVKLDFDDVLIEPKRSELTSRSIVDITRTYKFRHHSNKQWTGIPIIASNMSTIGTISMARAMWEHDMMCALHKYCEVDNLSTLATSTFRTFGVDWENLTTNAEYICIDVANGYQEQFVKFVKYTRVAHPNAVIMAGNVCTGSMTEELILAGADIVKVGIGPGMACSTRDITGIGVPQLSAIIECADAAHGLQGHVCADGGCRKSADVVKAFAAGADFVMLGYMLAGHDECEGNIQEDNTMEFYGMSSKQAMETFNGGVNDYRTAEGVSMRVPYKGAVKDTLQEIRGGIRSACTYVGANNLRELSKRTTFVRLK